MPGLPQAVKVENYLCFQTGKYITIPSSCKKKIFILQNLSAVFFTLIKHLDFVFVLRTLWSKEILNRGGGDRFSVQFAVTFLDCWRTNNNNKDCKQ